MTSEFSRASKTKWQERGILKQQCILSFESWHLKVIVSSVFWECFREYYILNFSSNFCWKTLIFSVIELWNISFQSLFNLCSVFLYLTFSYDIFWAWFFPFPNYSWIPSINPVYGLPTPSLHISKKEKTKDLKQEKRKSKLNNEISYMKEGHIGLNSNIIPTWFQAVSLKNTKWNVFGGTEISLHITYAILVNCCIERGV